MPFTAKQNDLITVLDQKAKEILNHGGQEELLHSLSNKMTEIKDIIDSASHDELDELCRKYDGFYQYMRLLELMAQACADGSFKDLLI